MKLLSVLALLPLALGEQFVIPEVASAVAEQLRQFSDYVHYTGPTGHAASQLAATPSLKKLVAAQPTNAAAAPYWYEQITHQGKSPFNTDTTYTIYRNVKDFGATGNGVTDDTAAINRAISSGNRCAPGACNSSSITPAVVYFPAGTYVISSSIIDYYNTLIIGNPNDLPILRATATLSGFGIIDGDQYQANNALGFGATNIFWRQVRNFILDMTAIPASSAATGIHWPTAQATSLQNIIFNMSSAPGTQHQGIFVESGSGGFMTDLTFYGGRYGAVFGNQQFTTRNMTFYNAVTAISHLYDWGWTYQGISINNCTNGFNISNGGPSALTTGGITVLDSTISNTRNGFVVGRNANSSPATAGSLTIENVALNNVPVAIQYGPYGQATSTVLAGTTGSTTIGAWGSGNQYTPNGPSKVQGSFAAPSRPAALLSGNRYYTRSKPQYNNLPVTSFSSVKAGGAKGDGKTDDTAAIQNVINAAQAAGKVVYFDAGSYVVTGTINIPASSRVVGEAYATILGFGSYFTNINTPHPVVTIGHPGGQGTVEWSDMIVSTQGPSGGAILIQWNLAAPAGTPGGMWDVHTRVGGTIGSYLRSVQCPAQAGNANVNPYCYGAYMLMQIAPTASGVYMENCWLWTADHDVDAAAQTQITVYSGRGLLIESTNGPTWLVGTAVEHNEIYQYQIAHTTNIYAGQIQTETPYYQPAPPATRPYAQNTSLDDPNWSYYCPNGQVGPCAEAWGLRVDQSSNIHIYGAGLYSFFSNYSTHCSDAGAGSDCQSAIFVYDSAHTSNLYVYNLNTIGSYSMVSRDLTRLATYSDNINVFPSTIQYFRSN